MRSSLFVCIYLGVGALDSYIYVHTAGDSGGGGPPSDSQGSGGSSSNVVPSFEGKGLLLRHLLRTEAAYVARVQGFKVFWCIGADVYVYIYIHTHTNTSTPHSHPLLNTPS